MTMSFTFDFVSFATAFTSRREMVQVPNDLWLDSDTLNSVFGASGSVRGGFARSAVTRCPTFAIALPRSGHDAFFFFQAEDGIRDLYVTGVQTCALPIWPAAPAAGRDRPRTKWGG